MFGGEGLVGKGREGLVGRERVGLEGKTEKNNIQKHVLEETHRTARAPLACTQKKHTWVNHTMLHHKMVIKI